MGEQIKSALPDTPLIFFNVFFPFQDILAISLSGMSIFLTDSGTTFTLSPLAA